MNYKILLFGLIFLISCASQHFRETKKLRKLVETNNNEAALKFLKEGSLSKDENSKLLFLLEQGLLEHYQGHYQESINSLLVAQDLLDQYFTTHLSNKMASFLSNDNADLYYGEKYEASLVHFYLSLNYYLLGDLEKARAEVLAWDSFLTEIKEERLGKALFKEDLLAKTFGALVHESQGTNQDLQIALQLYTDAREVAFKNYNLFPTFNSNYQAFKEHFSELPKLQQKEIEETYVKSTDQAYLLQNFLTLKILLLTKKVRPFELKQTIKKLNPSKDILTAFHQKNSHVTILVQDGLISEKYPKKYEYPLVLASPAPLAMSLGNKIQFELPAIEPAPHLEVAKIQALDQAGHLISEAPLPVLAPLGELAQQAVNEHSKSIAVKTGTRVASKHVAAIMAAQAAKIAARDNLVASIAAVVSYTAAVAAINESEKADIRYWSTLPSSIRMGELSLAPGTYNIQAVYGTPGTPQYRTVPLGEKIVSVNKVELVMNNKNHHYESTRSEETPYFIQGETRYPATTNKESIPKTNTTKKSNECTKDEQCGEGRVCATVRGEYPGSCAETGFPKIGRSSISCSKDSECGIGRVCATVRGEYPGSCADKN